MKHLRQVFTKLRENNLKLKAEKCSFLKRQLIFLGHMVSTKEILSQDNKVEAIQNMPPPMLICDIQVFLGITGYYCHFIPNYAHLAEPIV